MRVSYVSENKPLEQFLNGYESITLVNKYSNLQLEYDRFSGELNKVDIFAVIEHADISNALTGISKLIQSGDGYLLSVSEVLVILNGSTEKTPNRSDKIVAFTDILKEKGFTVRVVTPDILDFTSIYNALIKNTTVSKSKVKVFTKYKVYRGDNGIALNPKKTKGSLKPDLKMGNRKALRKVDNDTSELLGDTKLIIDERVDPIERSISNIVELSDITKTSKRLVFITGVTDVGKTHTMLNFSEELSKSQISSLVIDSTGGDDLYYIAEGNNFKTHVIRGSEVFSSKDTQSIGVHLFSKAYTSTFISKLSNLTKNKNLTFCEVGLDNLRTFEDTWDGPTSTILVVRFDVIALMELKSKIIKNKNYIIFVNNDKDIVEDSEVALLKQILGSSIKVYNQNTINDMFNYLGGI